MDSIIPLGQKNTLAEYMILSTSDCDMKETNITLQGLPTDIYLLVNHHRVAKDLWERVQLQMQDSGLVVPGPPGHRTVVVDYLFNNDLEYLKTSDPEVTYTTSITKIKAARYEIKGIEYMVPTLWSTIKHAYDKDAEKGIKHWGERRKLWYQSQVRKFSKQNVYSTKAILGVKSVSAKKLHGYGNLEEIMVKRSNQQLYKFKEGDFVDLHLNDIEDMLLVSTDLWKRVQLLITNVPLEKRKGSSLYKNPQLQQQFPLSQYGSIHPTQHYASTYPSQPQFNHSSVLPSYPYQSQMSHQTSSVPQIAYQSPQVSTEPMTELPLMDSGFAILVFSPRDDPIACFNKAMAFLTIVASSRVMLLVLGETMQVDRQGLLNATTIKTKDLDTYDSDCDDVSNAKAVLMANISNYGSDVISEVPYFETYLNDMENQSVHVMQDFEQTPAVDVIVNEITSDSNIILYSQYLQETKHANANKKQNNESVTAELERYKERVKTFEQRPNIDLSSREKMIDSQIDDMIKESLALKEQVDSLEKNLSKQIKEKESLLQSFTIFKNESKEKENKYMENEVDLEKKIKELDNIIFKVGQSVQTVHIFDNVVKIRTTPDARIEGEWRFKHTKAVFNNEIIPFLKSLKDIFNVFDRDLLNEIMEVQTVFDQMDAVVQQSSVDKQCLEIAKK
ncbi:hypothetical protein Tco_1079344 [Tanacetum coccineum]|uniref:Uncharacterized protein n=1 Tax=Tanacetum coccineum TaxID=301880 RepID=A0ABQ5HSF8_9ASTR